MVKKDSITKVAVVGNTRLTLKGLSHLKLLPNVEVKLILGLSEKSLAQKVNSVSYDSLLFECDDARLIKSDQWIEFEIYCIEENIDLIISLGDSRIVPESIINYFNVIGNHGAVLPDVQGGASLVWGRMLNNGEWGVSIMKIDKQIDSGDILNVKKFKYNTDLSQLDFCEKCDDLTIQALEEVLKGDYNKIQNTKWDVKVAKHTDSLETVKLLKYCIENNLSIYLPPRTPQDSQIKSEWDDSFKFCFKIANDNPYPKYNE